MKKWNYLLSMFLIAGTVLVTSCSKDEEDPGPELNLKGTAGYTATDATIAVGETIRVGIMTNAGDGGAELKNLKVTSTNNNIPANVLDTVIDGSVFNIDLDLTFTEQFIGANRMVFTVTDKDNKTDETVITITVEDGATAVNKYVGIRFGSHNDEIGSFYNSAENLIYTITPAKENQSKIDFIYYYGAEHGNTIAAPDDEIIGTIVTFGLGTWTTKNATRFSTGDVTAAQFDAIEDDFEFPTFAGTEKYIDNIEVNDVIYFKTAAGKLGLIKVVNVTTPNRGDQATFDIIVQE